MTMQFDTVFVLLAVIATAVAIAVRRLNIPYTVALVLTGLLLGGLRLLEPPHLTRELLFAIFLPGLLFEAAFHLEFRDFWRNRLPVVSLAVPGVAVAIALTAAIVVGTSHSIGMVEGLGWAPALVFGALIAATDPIAVVGLFRTLGAPRRLAVLLEGESLFNDGTAIVFFGLVLGLVGGEVLSARQLVIDFVRIVGMGALFGAAIGLAVAFAVRRIDDPMIEITLTTIAAYGSFVTAERFHDSGVIATVVAGMLCGNFAARTGMTPSTRVAVETFWEYVAFALNSVVFLLIGFEVNLSSLLRSWPIILVAYAAVLSGRAIVILGISGLLHLTRRGIPKAWSVVLVWGGLRGGLSMVLVLALPRDFPHRELLVSVTFGVVLLAILVQGLTMSPLLRWLGVIHGHAKQREYELKRGLLQSATAALNELERMSKLHFAHPELLDDLRQDYQQRVDDARREVRSLHGQEKELRDEEMRRIRKRLLLVEKQRAIEMHREGLITQETYDHLLEDIDGRLWIAETGAESSDEDEGGGPPADPA